MNNYKISVIIPFYNTSFILFNKCVNSVINQSFHEFETIIVDDGSEKQYSEYLDEKYGKVKNLRIFHITNQGVSNARNFAISKSCGDNICFVDSDDYIAPWMLEDMYNAKVKYDADICISYMKKVSDSSFTFDRNQEYELLDCSIRENLNFIDEIILRGINIKENKYGFLSCGPCSILVDANIAKQVKFPVDIFYMEDVIWNYKVFSLSNKVVKVNETLYAYVDNIKSATHKFDQSIVDERIKALCRMHEILSFNKNSMQWYALRVLCNFSMIYYQYGHIKSYNFFDLIRYIQLAYKITYSKQWRKLLNFSINKNWEFKYKFKHLLYKMRILPLLCIVKEFVNSILLTDKEWDRKWK